MRIYADNNATSLVDPAHFEEVIEILKRVDGNPSSIHSQGREAKVALENARASVCALLGARTSELVFTSGATESNNLLIQGLIQKQVGAGAKPHVLVSAIEHSAVLEPTRLLAERGLCTVTEIPVDAEGRVDPDQIRAHITPETVLVCIMHANNETGVIQPIYELASLAKEAKNDIHFHVDAVQMAGKADLSGYASSEIDSAAISCHKLGGFKGAGALYLRAGTKLGCFVAGGGQERGRRPGTENLPGIISFGLIASTLLGREDLFGQATMPLRDMWIEFLSGVEGAKIHCSPEFCLPNTVNFHVAGVPGEDILLNFDLAGIQASSGSACSSGVGRPSHVLKAIGYDDTTALNSIRTSFHPSVTPDNIQQMAKVLNETVSRSRR